MPPAFPFKYGQPVQHPTLGSGSVDTVFRQFDGGFMVRVSNGPTMYDRYFALAKELTVPEFTYGERDDQVFPELFVDYHKKVQGSKGKIYTVTGHRGAWTCTCVGFGFRNTCKHVTAAQAEAKESYYEKRRVPRAK